MSCLLKYEKCEQSRAANRGYIRMHETMDRWGEKDSENSKNWMKMEKAISVREKAKEEAEISTIQHTHIYRAIKMFPDGWFEPERYREKYLSLSINLLDII